MKRNSAKSKKYIEIWDRFSRNKSAMAGLIVLTLILLVAIFADVIYDYDTDVIGQNIIDRLKPSSAEHPLGTDIYGRDILARIVYGARMSLLIGFATMIFSLVAGGFIGACAGFFGGRADNLLMRLMDVLLALPSLILAIAVVAALGASTINLIIALGVSKMPGFARLMRVSVLSIREQEYVEASRADGARSLRIIWQDILPNIVGPILVEATLSVASLILASASLSFMGLGVQPPMPEWGSMLSEGRPYMRSNFNLILYPGLCVIITVLSLNLLGDGLRDALDPRLKD